MHRLFTPAGGDADPVFRIGLGPIPVRDWFEGGELDPAARKDALLSQHPALVWGETEGSRPAQSEGAEMIETWSPTSPSTPAAGGSDPPPLWRVSRHVADDLCLMERRPVDGDGEEWTLTAASLCAPSFFTAAEAVGRPLSRLHAPVPGFGETLLPRVARIFDRLATDTVLERRNWSVVSANDLFLPSAGPLRAKLADMTPEAIGASLVVRRERQTLRRLPQTGAVLFTIRIWREPLADLLADDRRRIAFADAWARLMSPQGEPFRLYKGLHLFDPAVRRLLDLPSPLSPA